MTKVFDDSQITSTKHTCAISVPDNDYPPIPDEIKKFRQYPFNSEYMVYNVILYCINKEEAERFVKFYTDKGYNSILSEAYTLDFGSPFGGRQDY